VSGARERRRGREPVDARSHDGDTHEDILVS
jgi:hypothetical protein